MFQISKNMWHFSLCAWFICFSLFLNPNFVAASDRISCLSLYVGQLFIPLTKLPERSYLGRKSLCGFAAWEVRSPRWAAPIGLAPNEAVGGRDCAEAVSHGKPGSRERAAKVNSAYLTSPLGKTTFQKHAPMTSRPPAGPAFETP